ncbi:MAG TPA: hypothetical protein VIM11_16140 [Tepidisphaeraceae bacterium]|jgi:hypothetical protein
MLSFLCGAADPIYSGPQLGEKVTTFKVADVSGVSAGRVREVLPGKDRAAVLVFISGVERSIVPLMTVVDQYGYERRDSLSAEFVFLSDDRVASTKRLPLVGQSLGMRCPMTISVDGPEGPGNYGLNKAVLMTILVAKEGRVTANFALVQPGIADAPAVIAAMAKASGDANPPTAEVLRERRLKATGGSSTRRAAASMPSRPAATGQKTELPGAAPTDAKLLAMLRSFIQPDNDDAKVDRIAREVEDYVKDNPELTRQAVGGWTRVLYLKYGTEYARNAGQKLVERLKK